MEACVHQSDLLLIELLLKLLIKLDASLEIFDKVKLPTVNKK